MGRHRLARPRPRHRTATALAVLVVPATAFLTAGATTVAPVKPITTVCCPEIVMAAPLNPADSAARHAFASSLVHTEAASRAQRRALSVGVASERGLQVKTILAARAVSAVFPEIHEIGGVRPDYLKWHPTGLAIDVMIPDYNSSEGKALGDLIARYALANADRFGLNHVIWRQVYYPRDGSAHLMSDLGDDNANHYTHVHIATDGGGYPTGQELYFG
ncbi:hypothetical protein [Mycolicibacterium komossense]|uniref:ARB-07466-like C-terminal domain-containing protein n=1 Tax=Mycolicibacterium komossense TaxID=1779 RepID=A0ABT3CIM5_9MYCO|nr:hypothetical protein [Mycolicibacterium komossense]MCV7229386.1 hypothetical protein [Mycolicibacterium komossense]